MKRPKIFILTILIVTLLLLPFIYYQLQLRIKYQGSPYLREQDQLDTYDFEKNVRFEYDSIQDAFINDHYKQYPFNIGDPTLSTRLNLSADTSAPSIADSNDMFQPLVYKDKDIFFIYYDEELGERNWYGPFRVKGD